MATHGSTNILVVVAAAVLIIFVLPQIAKIPTHGTVGPEVGLLHTSGIKIVDRNNEEVVFYGIFSKSFWGAYYPGNEGKPILTLTDIDNIRNHGLNHIRLEFPLGYLFHDQPMPVTPQSMTYNRDFFTKLDTIVDYGAEKGIWISLNSGGDPLSGYFNSDYYEGLPWWCFDGSWSLQPYHYPNTRPTGSDQALYDFWNLDDSKLQAVRELWLQTWKVIGSHYKDKGNVLFSIWNEPFMDKTIWASNIYHGAQHYADFCQQTVDAIRQGDTNNHIVIINDAYYYSDHVSWELNQQYPVRRANIINDHHFYHNYFKGKSMHDVLQQFANYAWANNIPYYIGEYGLMDGGGNYNEPMGDAEVAELLSQTHGGLTQEISTVYFTYQSDPYMGDGLLQPAPNPGSVAHTSSVVPNSDAVWAGSYGVYSWNVLDANKPGDIRYYGEA